MNDESHDEIEAQITRLLDGELAEAERTELERQLLCDPEAHAMLREVRALDEQVRAALAAALAPRRAEGSPGRRMSWPAVAAVAAAVVLAGVLWATLRPGPDRPGPHVAKAPDGLKPTTAAVEMATDQFIPAPRGQRFLRPVRRIDRFPVGLFDAESGQFRIIDIDREQTQTQPVWLDL